MAKKARPVGGGWKTQPKPGDTALGDFAADLGRFLGNVQNRASGWMDQRTAIVEQLTSIRDTANDYLQQISGAGATAAAAYQKARRGRPPAAAKAGPAAPPPATAGPKKKGGRRKGGTMSAEARAKIAAAQRKRWAKQRKQAKQAARTV